jgi:hypothetical protein
VTATFKVHLQRSDQTYTAGELLQGTVFIHDSFAGHDKLVLEHYWVAHGEDIHEVIDRGDSILIIIINNWEAGITEVPFEFIVPNGPFSFKGTETFLDCEINLRFEDNQNLQLLTTFYIKNTFLKSEPNFGSKYKIWKNDYRESLWFSIFAVPIVFILHQLLLVPIILLIELIRLENNFNAVILILSELIFLLSSFTFAFRNIVSQIILKNLSVELKTTNHQLMFTLSAFPILNINTIKVKINLSQYTFASALGYQDSIFYETLKLEIPDCKRNQTKFFETEVKLSEKAAITFASENFVIETRADILLLLWGWFPWLQHRHMLTIYPKLIQPTDLFTSQTE